MQQARASIGELARFCAVGGLCYAVAMGVLTFLCEVAGVHYVPSFVLAFLVANAIGYSLNARYTFGSAGLDSAAGIRYILVNTALLVMNTLALAALVEWLGLWYVAATVLLAAANVPVSFLAHRLVSYRLGSQPVSEDVSMSEDVR